VSARGACGRVSPCRRVCICVCHCPLGLARRARGLALRRQRRAERRRARAQQSSWSVVGRAIERDHDSEDTPG